MATKKKAKAGASARAGATKRKKAPAKKTKKAAKKPAAKKSKKSPAKKAKKKTKKAAPGMIARAIKAVKKAVTPAKKKKASKQAVGEGDYAASKAFLKDQSSFVARNKAKIPDMGKAAEKALDGPEGDSLRAAEAEAAGHSRDTFDA